MRAVIKVFLCLFALGLFHGLAIAEDIVTLQSLLEEAKENPELKSISELVKANEARAKVEGALEDPNLKIEMEDLSRTHPLNIAPGNTMLTRYTISQAFPFPGKLSLKEKIALKEASASRSEFNAKELEIRSMIKEAYFDYAFLNESIRKTNEIKEIVASMSEIAQSRYSTGQVYQQDVIKLNVESIMITNELITLEAEKELAAAKIKSLVNRAQDSQLGEPAELPKDKVAFNIGELINTALQKNPDIKMIQSGLEANELNVDLAGKNYYPDFMVGVAPIQRDGRFDSYDLMFQINIPIWRGKYNNRSAEARANAESLRLRLASERNIKGLAVKGAAVQVDASERMRTLYETSLLPQVELSFESALNNYSTGRIDLITLLDTERELRKTRIEYLKTILEYRKRIAALERAVGEDFRNTAFREQDIKRFAKEAE